MVVHPDMGIVAGNGTSFATPLLAGLAASLWSARPDENAMQIRERILRSTNRYTSPDTQNYKYGYGIPDAWKAYTMDLPQAIENIRPADGNCQKVLRNGQIFILRDRQVFNITGQQVQ